MTKAEETHQRIEALVESGITKAEAFKQLAGEYGQPVDSVRGAYYSAKRARSGAPTRRRAKKATTPEAAVAIAVSALEESIEAIEAELTTARERAAEAMQEFNNLRDSSTERIQEIKAKIELLQSSPKPKPKAPAKRQTKEVSS